MVMYEIVMRLVKTNKIKPSDVDIYYFGQMIKKTLPTAHTNEMMKEIKKYWKNWNELEQDDLPKFTKRGKKSRIVFAGG
jgi:chromatin segregation and condensation protein Rec8/ScpA/Scc1 (kleisin family)